MRRMYLLVMALIIVILSVVSSNLYQENKEAKSEVYRKELLIFQNHITGTVRAIDKQNKTLLDDTLLRLSTFETFHSPYISSISNAQLTLDTYEQGLRYLLNSNPNDYDNLKDNLNDIFNTLTSYERDELTQQEFYKIIDELFPKVEEFKDDAKTLSGN